MSAGRTVLVVGGGGYVGARLVPKLLEAGLRVRVLDIFVYGKEVFRELAGQKNLELLAGDVRDRSTVENAVAGCESLVHLACISNDPSYELDPALGRAINFDAFEPLVKASRAAGVQRFVYASSSSVYGVSEVQDVTEDHPRRPLTDYSKCKALCEAVLEWYGSSDFTTTIVRPATVCGDSPRLRLDLTVNLLTSQAVNNGRITVFGGAQFRPNIHIEDITDLYVRLLDLPRDRIAGKTYNAGYQNHSVARIAEIVRDVVQREMPGRERIEIVTTATNDNRSYHISSEKIRAELGFVPRGSIESAVSDLVRAFREGRVPDALTDDRYYNVKLMQRIKLR